MPYAIKKVRNKPCYKVYNTITKVIHAKCTTQANANKQLRLLNALEHGWKPKNRSTSRRSRTSSRRSGRNRRSRSTSRRSGRSRSKRTYFII